MRAYGLVMPLRVVIQHCHGGLLLTVLLDALAEPDRRALHRRPHRAKESFDESALAYHGRSSYAALRRGVENVGERIAERIGNTNDLRQRSPVHGSHTRGDLSHIEGRRPLVGRLLRAVPLLCPLEHRPHEIGGGMALGAVDQPGGDNPAGVAL